MEDKIFDFIETRDALSQLSADLIEFEALIKIKQTNTNIEKQKNKDELRLKEEKIVKLSSTVENALKKIENINQYIDGVLWNGYGYN